VPAHTSDGVATGGKPGAGAPTSGTKIPRDSDRVPDSATFPVSLTVVVPMALEGTMAAMGAMFGVIYFRRACQSNDVLSQGMNARYNPVQGSVLLRSRKG
jgi:hypothetical protein